MIIVLLRVLNQKKKAEKNLAYSESRLELALDGANEGLWDVDFINGEIFISQRFARLLKYNNPNEIGFNTTNYKNFFHLMTINRFLKLFKCIRRVWQPFSGAKHDSSTTEINMYGSPFMAK